MELRGHWRVRLMLLLALSWIDSSLCGKPLCAAQQAESGEEDFQHQPAQLQLEAAIEIQESARGRKGPRRLQIMQEAIVAYQMVNQWPLALEQRALASFRRGEIHRALEEGGSARGAFEEVLEVTARKDDLYIRAVLELGHLDRNEQRWVDCKRRYQQAIGCKEASLRYRNDAREWLVKVHLITMAWTSAVIEAEAWLEFCEGPVEEIVALDLQLRAMIGARQLREARERLIEIQLRMAVLAAAPTPEGRRIHKALEQMKAPEVLQLARQNGR